MLYSLIISPIEFIVEWIFNFILVKIESIGVMGAVFGVSLSINFLALPLYNVADALQAKERKIAKSLEYRVNRIKKAFKGDEQFMMISEYYRQNNYHPLYVLRSSLSILIEIPFFIAAYHFLSHNEALSGASFWIFKNLGAPDALFKIGSFQINVLPILMTLINFVSGAIYLKECPFREKIQLYGIAIVFLVLLYNSPSGLVLYWILNNIFSLCKNIVLKTKNPRKFVYYFFSIFMTLLSIALLIKGGSVVKIFSFIFANIIVICLPILKKFSNKIKNYYTFVTPPHQKNSSLLILILSGLGLALLAGFVLPSSVINSSPIEFSFLGNTPNPDSYITSSIFTFIGFFVFWPVAIYKMFDGKIRKILPILFSFLFITALLNVYVYKFNYGNVSISFQLDNTSVLRKYNFLNSVLPVITGFFIIVTILFINSKNSKLLAYLTFTLCIAEVGFGFYKLANIKKAYKDYVSIKNEKENEHITEISPVFHLSKTKKNVIILFFDRAISSYFNKALEQYPELKNEYTGFTYYPNTVSASTNTYLAYPAMTGGYEYFLEELNNQPGLLRDKFAQASLVQPKLFKNAGWNVTMSDIVKADSYSNNQNIYNDFSENELITNNGKYNDILYAEKGIKNGVINKNADKVCRRQIINFSVMQILYAPLRLTFYNNMAKHAGEAPYEEYYSQFSTAYYFSKLFDFTSDNCNYIFIENEMTHCPITLDQNFEFPGSKNNVNEYVYYPSHTYDQMHYDVNVCMVKTLVPFIKFLKQNNVYDNTRIILVSDHGRDLDIPELGSRASEKAYFNPLLLYKDFNATGTIKTDNTFMTNADTLFLAKKDLPISNINPYTGKELIQNKDNGITVYESYGDEFNGDTMREASKFTLIKEKGFFIHDNIFVSENWEALK